MYASQRTVITFYKLLLAMLCCAVLPACASPPQSELRPQEFAYGDHPRQRIDVYARRGAASAPMVVMVHGGAWRIGDKRNTAVVENKLAHWGGKGLVFMSVNYRLLPAADPREQARDVAQALAYIQRHAGSWGGDASKLVLMGHSAGAHLVSLLSVSAELRQQQGVQPWLGTVSIDTAAFDLVRLMANKHPRFYDRAFGSDQAYWRRVSPFHQLQEPTLPVLAICSSQRKDRPCDRAEAMATRARQFASRFEVLPVEKSHRQLNQQLGSDRAYTAAVDRFLASLDEALARRLLH